nr:oligosaccharide flippase family protein [uncultured Pedobacter sp.]
MSISRVKALAKDSVIYGLSSVITRTITIFLVPIYTRIFTPQDYGVINLINTTFFLVGMFCVFGLDSSAARWFYDSENENDKKSTISTWFWFQFFISVFLGVCFFILTPIAGKFLLEKPTSEIRLLWLIPCIILVTDILPKIITSWFRYMLRPISTLVFTASQSIFTVGLTFYFVVYEKLGIVGVFLALLISSFIFSIVSIIILKSWISFRFFRKEKLISMLKYALPLVPATLAYWVLNTTDSYFLLIFKDQASVGLFAIGASIASCVSLVTGAFQQAWGPFAFSIHKEPDAQKTYANVFYVFGVIASVIILFMFSFTPEIIRFFTTKDYYKADWVASILSLNLILIAFTYIASIGTGIAKNNKPYATAIFIGAILTVILDILLIPSFGINGSAIATVVAQLIVPVFVFYHAQKLYYINYDFISVAGLLITPLIIGIGVRFLPIDDFYTFFAIKILVFFSYIFILYRFNLKKIEIVLQSVKHKS